MKVLITGNNGYIGSVAVGMFVDAGYDVVGLDSNLYDGCDFEADEPGHSIPVIRKDIRDLTIHDLEGIDAVVHLAGLSNDPLGDLDPRLTFGINVTASATLARLAREAGVRRFLFSSSCSTYGAAGDELLNESAPFNPVTRYGASKLQAEREIRKLATDNFSPTYLRNATAYGVSPRLRLDIVLNNLVAFAYTTGRVLMMSDGSPWRPIIHIRDIVAAFLAILDAPQEVVHNTAYNVGMNSQNYRIGELAEIVASVVPGSRIEYSEDAGPDKRCYRVDCSKIAREVPGFKPCWNARAGAVELYEAYRHAGLTADELRGHRYIRIRHIKTLLDQHKLNYDLRWRSSVQM